MHSAQFLAFCVHAHTIWNNILWFFFLIHFIPAIQLLTYLFLNPNLILSLIYLCIHFGMHISTTACCSSLYLFLLYQSRGLGHRKPPALAWEEPDRNQTLDRGWKRDTQPLGHPYVLNCHYLKMALTTTRPFNSLTGLTCSNAPVQVSHSSLVQFFELLIGTRLPWDPLAYPQLNHMYLVVSKNTTKQLWQR